MPFRKRRIPRALKETLWLKSCGKVFETKCHTPWCLNKINVYDFHSGHRIPESKGGPLTLENLVPLCARCNLSMGNQYTFDEWCLAFRGRGKMPAPAPAPTKPPSFLQRLLSCFSPPPLTTSQLPLSAPPARPPKKVVPLFDISPVAQVSP